VRLTSGVKSHAYVGEQIVEPIGRTEWSFSNYRLATRLSVCSRLSAGQVGVLEPKDLRERLTEIGHQLSSLYG
jgi:hypothetical protein